MLFFKLNWIFWINIYLIVKTYCLEIDLQITIKINIPETHEWIRDLLQCKCNKRYLKQGFLNSFKLFIIIYVIQRKF